MKTKLLNWAALGWDRFQKLSNQIAQQELGLRFEDFLKKGNKQDGIDGISTLLNKEGKHTVVQCKDEDLSPSKITDLVDEFKKGKFFGNTSHFILATTSNMQTERRQERLKQLQKDLKAQKIDFECWDGNFFEDRLEHQYTLVAHYFGLNAANEHCLPKRNVPKSFDDLGPAFIPRRIEKLEKDQNFTNWYRSGPPNSALKDLLVQLRIDFPKICLIADPYQGKSLLLKQTAVQGLKINAAFQFY